MKAELFGSTETDPVKAMYNKGVHGGDDTESDEEEEETEYVDMDTNVHRPDVRRTYGNGNMVLYRQGPRSFTLGEVMEEPTATTTQVAPYAPERSGTERPAPNRTRTCTTLRTGQVVVYFWRKSDADGDGEGYSIGIVEAAEVEGDGTRQATAERKVRAYVNNDKNDASQYAEYEDFDPAERQGVRKEAGGQVVRDTITAENVLITTKASGKTSRSFKLTERRASEVTEAIARDSAARREDQQRREQERMEGGDEPSGATTGPEGEGQERGTQTADWEASNSRNGAEANRQGIIDGKRRKGTSDDNEGDGTSSNDKKAAEYTCGR
jgi:hypothetical protein